MNIQINNHHQSSGFKEIVTRSIRDIVFGLEDGMVSTLGVIIGIAEGSQSGFVVVLSGLVVIFVEALSMAAGTFLSAKSNKEVLEAKIRLEKREIEEKPDEEKRELIEIYKKHGLSDKEAHNVMQSVIKDKKMWLEEMKLHELGIADSQLENPKINAVFMWGSYVVAGFIPLSGFFFLPINFAVPLAVLFTIIALFIVGAGKTLVTKKSWFKSGLEMTAVALLAAALGFTIGKLVSYLY